MFFVIKDEFTIRYFTYPTPLPNMGIIKFPKLFKELACCTIIPQKKQIYVIEHLWAAG